MTMPLTRKVLLGCCVACVALAVVGATVGDNLLAVPLFEVGSLWIQAVKNILNRITSTFSQKPDFSSPWTYIIFGVASYVLYQLYVLFFVPINRVRLLGDLGYIPDGKRSMKEIANMVRKRREVGDVPPVYPNGWFAAMESRDLKKGESKTVSILGLTLAIFRGTEGTAYIVDAYCPHMGANLGVGGQVKGNCIECPFHGWSFRGEDGKCVDIPYLSKDQKITSLANVKSYTVLERNGFIYLWYHAEGVEPFWEPPEIEEISSGKWVYRGRSEHIVNCHIEDIPENGADVAHLGQVHGPIMTSGIDLRYTYSKIWSFAKHHWDGVWTASTEEDEKHIGTLSLKHTMSLFGIHVPLLDMNVKARQMGPGSVYMRFSGPTGCGVFLHHVTPLEPLTQKMVHTIYFSRYVPIIVPKFYLLAESLMMGPAIVNLLFDSRFFGTGVFIQNLTPIGPIMQHMRHHIYLSPWTPSIVGKFFLAAEAIMIGPGIVYLMLNSPLFGKGAFLQSLVPTGPLNQRMVHSVYYNKWVPNAISKLFLFSEALMVERDIMIWNNKKYEGKPVFVKSKEDALVSKHRRWYSQFYSENSPRLTFKKNSLEW